jgi:hypothetical protein
VRDAGGTAMTKWKVGDRCYWEFKEGTVKEMQGERVTGLTDGCVGMYGYDLREVMQPDTDFVKTVSARFYNLMKPFYDMNCGLNIPDIHRWFVALWMDVCEGKTPFEVANFSIAVLQNEIDKALRVETHGMRVFR